MTHELSEFERDIMAVVNRHSMENMSGTPDFVLAVYLNNCLAAYSLAVAERETWYGRGVNNRSPRINEAGMRAARGLPKKVSVKTP